MCYSNISSCTNTDKCSSAVNMDDIVLSATVNILGSEFKLLLCLQNMILCHFKLFYCYLSIDEGDAIVPSLPYYDVSTEQATEEMLFDFGTSKLS